MQLIRRLLIVIIWANAIFWGVMASLYLLTIFRTDGPIPTFVPLGIAAALFCVFLLAGYILHRIVNYIIGVPAKSEESA